MPCQRRGLNDLDRLRHRFEQHACVYEVYVRSTQTCRYQHPVGARRPNQYGRVCRAQLYTDEIGHSRAPPLRT